MADNSVEAQQERQIDRLIGEKESLRAELQRTKEDVEREKRERQQDRAAMRRFMELRQYLAPGEWDRLFEDAEEPASLPDDEWVDLGSWLCCGGIRAATSKTKPTGIAIRFQEASFFTQVFLPLPRLQTMLRRIGFAVVDEQGRRV